MSDDVAIDRWSYEMISESRRFAISNVMLVLSIGLLAFVSMDSFGTGCANAATGSCQVGDTETFAADLGLGGDVIFEGVTIDDFETSLTATDPTADRTITMPDYSGDLAVYTGGEGTATQVLTSNGPGVAPSYQSLPAAGTTEWWCESDYGDGRIKYGNSSTYESILTTGPAGLNCQTDITASQEGEGTYYATFETWWYVHNATGSTASLFFQYSPNQGGAANHVTVIQNGYQILCSNNFGYNSTLGVQGEWLYWGNDGATEYTTNSGWTSGESAVYIKDCRSVGSGHAFKITYTFIIRVAPNQGFNLYDGWNFQRSTGSILDYARMTRSILNVVKVSDRYS